MKWGKLGRVFEKKALRKIFGPKLKELTGARKNNCTVKGFMICNSQQVYSVEEE
jgi:hypothetical protein